MAMSWVAEAVVKRSSTPHSSHDGCAASCGTIAIVVAESTSSAPVIQCWRAPQRSTSGAHSNFQVHGRESRLISPISLSDTPWARKNTGQTS